MYANLEKGIRMVQGWIGQGRITRLSAKAEREKNWWCDNFSVRWTNEDCLLNDRDAKDLFLL